MVVVRVKGKWKTYAEMNEAIERIKKQLKKDKLLISRGYDKVDKHFFEYYE